jgi:hypothetical protein
MASRRADGGGEDGSGAKVAKFIRAEIGDPGPIAVELWRAFGGKIVGNVRRRREGASFPDVSPDIRARAAVHLAEIEADALGCDVLVIDPRELWVGDWGYLMPARK